MRYFEKFKVEVRSSPTLNSLKVSTLQTTVDFFELSKRPRCFKRLFRLGPDNLYHISMDEEIDECE